MHFIHFDGLSNALEACAYLYEADPASLDFHSKAEDLIGSDRESTKRVVIVSKHVDR